MFNKVWLHPWSQHGGLKFEQRTFYIDLVGAKLVLAPLHMQDFGALLLVRVLLFSTFHLIATRLIDVVSTLLSKKNHNIP